MNPIETENWGTPGFDEHSRKELKDLCKLPEAVVSKLDEFVRIWRVLRLQSFGDPFGDRCSETGVALSATRPPADVEQDQLRRLQSALDTLAGQLKNLHPYLSEEMLWHNCPNCHQLAQTLEHFSKKLKQMKPVYKPGNKPKDDRIIVRGIVDILLASSIKPRLRSSKFEEVLRICFVALQIDSCPQAAIQKDREWLDAQIEEWQMNEL